MNDIARAHVLRHRLDERRGFVHHDRKLASPTAGTLFIVVAHALTPDPVARPLAEPVALTTSGRRYRGLSAEERRADQRRRLVRAAIEEFAARGYHHTSVEDIVRSARTSRTAFYAFFDNREAAMYSALQESLRGLLEAVRCNVRAAAPDQSLIETGVTAFVGYLVSDPAAARILLLEGIGTSPEVNALRARVRSQVASTVTEIWEAYDPEAAKAPQATAVAVGVFGLLLESMLHLVETDRLDEAPAHVPALVCAVERMLAPAA
jgi:AcrR family transcriptional regulator